MTIRVRVGTSSNGGDGVLSSASNVDTGVASSRASTISWTGASSRVLLMIDVIVGTRISSSIFGAGASAGTSVGDKVQPFSSVVVGPCWLVWVLA